METSQHFILADPTRRAHVQSKLQHASLILGVKSLFHSSIHLTLGSRSDLNLAVRPARITLIFLFK